MRNVFIWLVLAVWVAGVSGWGSAYMGKIAVGMTKEQVVVKVGKPAQVVDSRKTPKGQAFEVWEYPGGGDKRLWVTFIDGKVVEWQRREFDLGRPVIPAEYR